MGYREHAIREFEYAGWIKDGKYDDDMQEMMCNQVLELLDLFGEHGHSGSSAPYAINLFSKLAKFEPIAPIQGTDDEWADVDNGIFQNKRLSSVFKKEGGKPYYLDAVIWKEKNGACFSGQVEGISSRQFIKFPFYPKRFYIDVVEENGEHRIVDKSQFDAVKEYYDFSE